MSEIGRMIAGGSGAPTRRGTLQDALRPLEALDDPRHRRSRDRSVRLARCPCCLRPSHRDRHLGATGPRCDALHGGEDARCWGLLLRRHSQSCGRPADCLGGAADLGGGLVRRRVLKLDYLAAEKRQRIYKMLRLKVYTHADGGTELSGILSLWDGFSLRDGFCAENITSRPDARPVRNGRRARYQCWFFA